MEQLSTFFTAAKSEMTAVLATSAEGRVTMRTVSPVPYQGGILLFTASNTEKYRQLTENPRCCIALGGFFAECEAALCGSTMLPENAALRAAYSEKFPGAFDAGVVFGGVHADFVWLRLTRLSGWCFAGGVPTADGIPDLPFAFDVDTPALRR